MEFESAPIRHHLEDDVLTHIVDKFSATSQPQKAIRQPDLFCADRMPRRPYCKPHKASPAYIRDISDALGYPIIQANPHCLRYRLVFDIDRPGAVMAWDDAHVAPASWTAMNPDNGHAHLAYEIDIPICTTQNGSAKALRYAGAVEAVYRDKLGADAAYSGLYCKNPLHHKWQTMVWQPEAYELGDLAEYVDLSKYSDRRRRLPTTGLGRNCDLFEDLRRWAYRSVDEYRNQGQVAYDAWMRAALAKAEGYNSQFTEALMFAEVKSVARSVGKWTWTNFYGTAESYRRFVQLQQARGSKGGRAKGAEKRNQGLLMLESGMEIAEIMDSLQVGMATVYRWKKILDSQ